MTSFENTAKRVDEIMLVEPGVAIPCEKCGRTESHESDRYHSADGPREAPLTAVDDELAKIGMRQIRICAGCWN